MSQCDQIQEAVAWLRLKATTKQEFIRQETRDKLARWADAIEAREREIERLREALKKIRSCPGMAPIDGLPPPEVVRDVLWQYLNEIIQTAQIALSNPSEGIAASDGGGNG